MPFKRRSSSSGVRGVGGAGTEGEKATFMNVFRDEGRGIRVVAVPMVGVTEGMVEEEAEEEAEVGAGAGV